MSLFGVITSIGVLLSLVLMFKERSSAASGQKMQEPLSSTEKLYIWLLVLISPIVSGAIFYYGWKKTMPVKARQANKINWLGFVIIIALAYASAYLFGFNYLGLPMDFSAFEGTPIE
jgi:magnesium-transporting ATPase (P-type)